MSLLPTAHAGQSFGSRRIDFFTVSGEVTSSDAGTGRIIDGDGVEHPVRLIERSSAFVKGDTASVLRVQSGPNRRSRPVAIVNHSRELWMRAAPDATSILARSGVTRTLNWWLSVLALILVAVAVAWPSLHVFLTELNAGLMAGVPALDIYAQLGAPMPGLAGWRLETALSPGLFDGIAALGFVPMEQLTEWGLAAAAIAMTLIAFFARSWRLVYLPALVVLCVFSGAILGSPVVSLTMIGGAILLFMLGGFINRVRDGGRFNARVERLAEYVLRHPPEEGVRTSEPARAESRARDPLAAAAAATTIAAASAVAEGHDQDDAQTAEGDSAIPETVAQDEDMPAEALASEETPAEPAESGANGEVAADTDDEPAAETGQAAPAPLTETEDDLPSMEAVAAAAALNQTERADPRDAGSSTQAPMALDDERTMPVAAPPPMPVQPVQRAVETPPVLDEPKPVETVDDLPAAPEPALPERSQEAEFEEVAESAEVGEVEDAVEAPTHNADIDDPMIDDDHDPMVQSASGDFAPGAPEIELDRE